MRVQRIRDRRSFVVALLALVLGLSEAEALRAQAPPGFRLIVPIANPATKIRRADAAAFFLGKAVRWGHGAQAAPVDQSMTSSIRARFSDKVLGQPIVAIRTYWQQQMFSGSLKPPPVKTSDDEVIAFVAADPGAVGYVADTAVLPATVKELALID
jgi:ABC-type phosphate transport system substrate-binding protein